MRSLTFTFLLSVICAVTILLSGCSALETPSPKDIMQHPLGTDAVRIGMTKDKVTAQYGKPDVINNRVEVLPSKKVRDEWIYFGRYEVPINKDYFSKTRYLYFDGDNLTDISETSLVK